jgi:endogenous inhibitor of DNA gyrase (YacG/DUF329 family)
MPSVSCPNCHQDFVPIYSVNMFDLDKNGKPQTGWVLCTECKETVNIKTASRYIPVQDVSCIADKKGL